MNNLRGRVAAVVLAAGAGRRMGARMNKVFLPLDGRPILGWTLEAFQAYEGVDGVVLVTAAAEREECRRRIVDAYGFTKVIHIVPGGASRQESEHLGLEALAPEIAGGAVRTVLVHDAVRPFVSDHDLDRLIAEARATGAAILAVPGTPSIFRVDEEGLVAEAPTGIWAAQTPQAFDARLLLDAHRRAAAAGVQGTDTSSIMEWAGHSVGVIQGSYENVKITTSDDLVLAEHIARQRGLSQRPLGEGLLHL
jgi:2-C-methyl-D-erythritol 4-phosphate cytidylyltransferase